MSDPYTFPIPIGEVDAFRALRAGEIIKCFNRKKQEISYIKFHDIKEEDGKLIIIASALLDSDGSWKENTQVGNANIDVIGDIFFFNEDDYFFLKKPEGGRRRRRSSKKRRRTNKKRKISKRRRRTNKKRRTNRRK